MPAVLIFIVYLKFFYGLYHKNWRWLVYLLSLLFLTITVYFETYLQWHLSNHFVYQLLGDKKFYYFFSYFYAGFLLAQYTMILKRFFWYFVGVFLLGLGLFLSNDFEYVRGFFKVLTNMGLIGIVLYLCQYQKIPIIPILAKIGQVSLPIYLWHVLLVLFLQKLPIPVFMYYLWSLAFFVIFITGVIYFEDKNAIINRLFYGKTGISHAK